VHLITFPRFRRSGRLLVRVLDLARPLERAQNQIRLVGLKHDFQFHHATRQVTAPH
jgi:hypothetical protein